MQKNFFNKIIHLIAVSSLLSGFVFAEDKLNNQPLNYVISENIDAATSLKSSTPNSLVTLDFSVSTAEFWGSKGNPQNLVANCFNGSVITGFKWNNVRIETVGNSFFSEAALNFTNSTRTGGPNVFVGFGSEANGISTFSSNGVFDLTDNSISDVLSTNDNKFFIEFFDSVDDSSGLDARFTSGTIEVHGIDLVPVDSCPFISSQVLLADLIIDIDSNSSTSRLGDEVDLLVTIQNAGTANAANVQLNYIIPRQLQFLSSNCDDGSTGTITENNLSVNLQNLNVSESVVCHLLSNVIHHGRINNSVSVETDNDVDITNNNANIILGGSALVIPVNNWVFLILLILTLMLIARKKILKI